MQRNTEMRQTGKKITKKRYNEEKAYMQSTMAKKMLLSGTCATSNISMGRKDERQERKKEGEGGKSGGGSVLK